MLQLFLKNINVKQRITLGFSAALSVAIAGTGVGFGVGNHYQSKAVEIDNHVTEEVEILSKLQIGVLQTRTHQQQLIPLSEFPDEFQDEYKHILDHAITIQTAFQELLGLSQVSLKGEHSDFEASNTEYAEFLETYQSVPDTYLDELNQLVTSVDLSQSNTPEELARIQEQFLAFTNSDLAIQFDGISDDLSGLIQEVNDKLHQAHDNVEKSGRVRLIIIGLSMLLSSSLAALLAYAISRSINDPLQAMEKTALQITQNKNFDLRVDVMGDDEVGTVATAFNLMIQQVNDLMAKQRMREAELEKSNQRLIATQTQMIAQEKLASLGSLTAGIAHEIKNPLNFVNNFAELAAELVDELEEELNAHQSELDPTFTDDLTDILEPLKANVNKIEQHGKRADRIVANMLMHSRSGESNWATININALIAEALQLAYHGMRAKQTNFNLRFDEDYDDSIDVIRGCPQDLNRVFLNIASNACYAVYQRQLEEGQDFTPAVKVRTRDQGDQVEIRIRDNGTGIAPEVQEQIFEQFFTTKPTGEGTGLGLSLSYSIVVEQHRGTLNVVSEPGLYAEFIVTLPKQGHLETSP